MRRTLALTTALLTVVALGACSSGSQQGSSDGSSDGRLTVYSGRNEALVGPILEQARKDLGLDIEVRYGSSAEMAAQLVEEGDRTPADLFLSQDAGALESVSAAGILTAMPEAVVDRVPDRYRAADRTWVGVTARARVLVVDPAIADEVPTSVRDLTDPKWKGRVGIAPANASFQSFITAMRVIDGEDATEKWLRAMQANDVRTYENNIAIVEAVDAGQIDVGLVNHYYIHELEKEKGRAPDVKLVFMAEGDPGSLVNVSGVGITTTGSKDPDAQALVDYLLGETAQRYFAKETNEYPLVEGAPSPVGVPALADLRTVPITLEQLKDLPGTLDLLQKVGLV